VGDEKKLKILLPAEILGNHGKGSGHSEFKACVGHRQQRPRWSLRGFTGSLSGLDDEHAYATV